MENWWLKTMDKKNKNMTNELNRIRFTNAVIFNNKTFNFSLLTAATFLLQHIFFFHNLKKLGES